MTSEVTSGLRIELSDLNYLCCHASLASNNFNEVNAGETKDIYDPLTCVALPQVKKQKLILEMLTTNKTYYSYELASDSLSRCPSRGRRCRKAV